MRICLKCNQEIPATKNKGAIYCSAKCRSSYVSYRYGLKIGKLKNPGVGSGGQNRKVNHNPFECFSEEAQYWIGFLAADGNLSKTSNTISLKIKDIEHVLIYRNFISPDLTPYYGKNVAGSLMCNIAFGHRDIYKYLNNIGITPAKSKTFKFNIPLTGHILRGYFDGDGSVPKDGPRITTGSINFRDQLSEYLNSLGIKHSITMKHKITDRGTFDINILSEGRRQFFNLLYTDSTVYLERKHEKFLKRLEKIKSEMLMKK
jgi:hypothetical protein